MIPLRLLSVFVIGTIFSLYPSADARIRALPLPKELKQCYQRAQNYTTQNYVGGQYCFYCESPLRAQMQKSGPTPLQPEQFDYARRLFNKVNPTGTGHRGKRQARRKCVRKEYRMLTDQERRNFHRVINILKNDNRTIKPNKYDALALFHTGLAVFNAHGGPGFCGWHRLYLLMFEAAMQEVDPSVCLPYWDSTIDSAIDNPAESYVWSEEFFGASAGDITRGPMARWTTPAGVALTRSAGRDGELMTTEGIEAILSRNTYEEILMPDEDPQYSLEFHHGGTHVFVGGDMGSLDTAAFDPIFFMHHAFIDYIWELFREKMRRNGLDPQQYPTGPSLNDYHQPNAPMGFGNFTHAQGYNDTLMDSYEYQPSPECFDRHDDCNSRFLFCNVTIGRCVPIDPADPPIVTPGPKPKPCPHPKPLACQNTFCVDGVCDINRWVWVPVKIVAQRLPEIKDYPSYPVQKGIISKIKDIYQPSAYSDTNRLLNPGKPKPKAYKHCDGQDGVGRILVSSMGLNYDGTYKESAIVDQRLAASIGVTYIAVKDPGQGATQVLLRAHDQCGRICHTACKIPRSNPPRYQACSGVVEVTPDYPLQYGATYASATLGVYDYAGDSDCPRFNTDDFFVTFYCDYNDYLPWVEKPVTTYPGPHRPKPLPTAPPPQTGSPSQCRISPECVINQPCFQDTLTNNRQCKTNMEKHACLNNCGRYAICMYGFYMPRYCPQGQYFDDYAGKNGQCVTGKCISDQGTVNHSSFRKTGTLSGQTPWSSQGSTVQIGGVRDTHAQPSILGGTVSGNQYYGQLLGRLRFQGKK